jgi:chromosome transmission fidelity protein 18
VSETSTEAGGTVVAGGGAPAAQKLGTIQFPVLYKFNEGYTNSVKRPLMMQELL